MLKNVGSVLQSERAAKRKENSFFFSYDILFLITILLTPMCQSQSFTIHFLTFSLDSADSIPLGFRNVSHDYSDLLQAFVVTDSSQASSANIAPFRLQSSFVFLTERLEQTITTDNSLSHAYSHPERIVQHNYSPCLVPRPFTAKRLQLYGKIWVRDYYSTLIECYGR